MAVTRRYVLEIFYLVIQNETNFRWESSTETLSQWWEEDSHWPRSKLLILSQVKKKNKMNLTKLVVKASFNSQFPESSFNSAWIITIARFKFEGLLYSDKCIGGSATSTGFISLGLNLTEWIKHCCEDRVPTIMIFRSQKQKIYLNRTIKVLHDFTK